MSRGKALPAILDYHLGRRLPPRFHRSKLSKRAFGKANFALGFKLFEYVGESQLRIAVLFGRADFCDRFSAVSDKKSLTFADCPQISSEAVYGYAAGYTVAMLHSATPACNKQQASQPARSWQ